MGNITRTVTTTHILVKEIIIEDGQASFGDLAPITVEGKLSKEKANKVAVKEYADKTVAVVGLEFTNKKYQISVEDFIANAVEVA